jgi:predicted protein tyrosine phosphatase
LSLDRRRKLLFVCTANRQRSPTAERIYKDDPRFEVRSAGTHAFPGNDITVDVLKWADTVVVMEERHAREIRSRFPGEADEVEIIVLDIPDVFQYMDQHLQREIRDRFEAVVG